MAQDCRICTGGSGGRPGLPLALMTGLLALTAMAMMLLLTASVAAEGAPVVSITSEGGQVGGTYRLSAEVSGDLQPGAVYYGIDDDDPDTTMTDAGGGVFQVDIDMSGLAEGPHTLYVKAVNSTGTSTVVSIAVDVDRNSPMVVLTCEGAIVAGDFLVTAEVSDPYLNESAIYCVFGDDLEASRDNVLARVGDHYEFTVDTTALPDGNYHLRVWAFDLWGSFNKSIGTGLVVDNTAPSVQITSGGGAHSGSYALDATVEDPHLDGTSIKAYVGADGPVAMQGGGSSWSLQIDLTAYPNGELVIVVEASDLPGSSSTEEITITVDNRPDLRVSFVDWGRTKLKRGEMLTVNASVINDGLVAASGFGVAIIREGEVLGTVTVPGPLEPGGVTTALVEWEVDGKGSFEIIIQVDHDDTVIEFNEDDNVYTEPQTIVVTEKEGDSPGPGAVVAVVVLTIVALARRGQPS